MQGLKGAIIIASIVATAATLGACHKQITHKPLKLGAVSVEQPARV